MKRSTTKILLGLATVLAAAACSGSDNSKHNGADDDDGSNPTPTPIVNPYEVCVAHVEQDVGDAPEVANLVLAVILSDYWIGAAQDVLVDGLTGAIYADYHYRFDGVQPPEYIGAISTNATVVITGSSNLLGASSFAAIDDEPLWYFTTGTGSTLSGGLGSVNGLLQALSDCTGGSCVFGEGSASLLVNGSSLSMSSANGDTVALLYCRDLPSGFAGWRPGQPLPPGFRTHMERP